MAYVGNRAGPQARRLRRRALAAGFALAAAGAWSQTISDVPMAVKNNVPPNMMFMIDNSGSMSNIVPEAPYSASATYPFTCTAAQTLAAGTVDVSISGGVPGFTYNGAGTVYHHVSAGGTNLKCFNNTAIYDARLLSPVSAGYLSAQYTGHFLNWYFGAFNGAVTGWSDRKIVTTGAVRSRIEIARASAKTVIDGLPLVVAGTTNPAVRVGLSTYNNGNGGKLVTAIGNLDAAKRTAIKADIDTLTPGGSTPLSETLADIGRYMATGYTGNVTIASGSSVGLDSLLNQGRTSCLSGAACTGNDAAPASPAAGTPGRPIQYWCQKSYVFMMTDGRPTSDIGFANNATMRDYDGSCAANPSICSGAGSPNYQKKTNRSYESAGNDSSDYLDDVAKALYDIDLRPNLPAPAGRTKKNNLLTYPIGFADLQVQNDPLLISTAAEGGGRFISAQDGITLTNAFKSAMTDAFAKDAAAAAVAVANAQITVNDTGYASSYNSGTWYGDLVAYAVDTSTGLQSGAAAWSALAKVDAQATRKIVSYNGSAGRAFTSANFAGTPSTLTAGVIGFLRGDRTGEGTTYRTRQHLLGDIINAEPVIGMYGGTPIVFQAANDGMLHVFDGRISSSVSTRGEELWAYVPRLIHSKIDQLSSPAYSHQYFVDATPAMADVTGFGPMTKILVGGLGKGGAGYYALDVTDYSAADETAAAGKVKWEFTQANMGYSYGTPLIVNTAAGWRIVVASGYANGSAGTGGDGRGYVWVLDPSDGHVVATLQTGVGSSADPSGLAHLARLANSAPDALVRFVYGGDLKGNVWRFDLDSLSVAKIATVTDATGAYQPITAPPEVGPVSGSSTRFYVYVGTGRYLADEDIPGSGSPNIWAAQTQSMYGLVDDTTVSSPALPNIRGSNGSTCPGTGGNGDLVCQSMSYSSTSGHYVATTHAVNLSARRGWYLDLPVTNGRVTGKPGLTTGGTLVFVADIPSNVTCDPGGSSWFFQVAGSTGGAIAKVVGGNEYFDSGFFLGDALGSRPNLVSTANGKRALIRMSDVTTQSMRSDESASMAVAWKRVYWRKLN
jgi:type IV pilus assembly protein PilY1